MDANPLKFNRDKTGLLIFTSTFSKSTVCISSLQVGDDIILPSDSAKNIGVIFDQTLTIHKNVNTVCKSSFYHLRNISKIRRYLSTKTAEILVHAFITVKLDFCNSLFNSLAPQYLSELINISRCCNRKSSEAIVIKFIPRKT